MPESNDKRTLGVFEILAAGLAPSEAFRKLFERGYVSTAPALVHLLYTELPDLSESVMPAVMAWNRGTRADRAGIRLTDDRLDEIIGDFIASAVHRREATNRLTDRE